jgi:hypothetical protein
MADAKLDSKHQLPLLNELCDLSNCNNALFFEARRKHGDLYLWAAKAPNGPSIRFHVLNAHTMDELKMTGNCLKGSRPIVVFDKAFDESPHMMVIKEVLSNVSTKSGRDDGVGVDERWGIDFRGAKDGEEGQAFRGPRSQSFHL